jgi:hypothetical protein
MIQQQTITTTVFVQPCDVEILNVFVVSCTLLQQWISLKLIKSQVCQKKNSQVKFITTQIKIVQLGDTNVKQSGPNTKKKTKVGIFTNYTD